MVEHRFDICVGVPWACNIDEISFQVSGPDASVCGDHMGQDCRWGDIGELHKMVSQNGYILLWYRLEHEPLDLDLELHSTVVISEFQVIEALQFLRSFPFKVGDIRSVGW